MQRFWVAVLILIALAGPVRAEPLVATATAAPEGLLCRAAVAAAERANSIPEHLLAAISRVESGRHDPRTGDLHPWPWSANAKGQGYFYATKARAVAAVGDMQAHDVRSIDVGCGQVNLMHHPNAFPNLEVAFDPQANANYAGKFLKELFDRTGDWNRAVRSTIQRRPTSAASTAGRYLPLGPKSRGCLALLRDRRWRVPGQQPSQCRSLPGAVSPPIGRCRSDWPSRHRHPAGEVSALALLSSSEASPARVPRYRTGSGWC